MEKKHGNYDMAGVDTQATEGSIPTSKQKTLMDSSVQFHGHSGIGGSEGVCP